MLFWPEISALGVFFNFDNERMHPPKYLSDPPGHGKLAAGNISRISGCSDAGKGGGGRRRTFILSLGLDEHVNSCLSINMET